MTDTRNETQRNHLRYSPPKRKGPTPEAKVSAAIDRYLKKIRAINIRTNAGSWSDDNGHTIMGAKAGTSDKTCCLPGGVFCAIEAKATTQQTEAQAKYQARVEALGGLYILARSAADVRAALIEHFGEAQVVLWEAQ